jgi:hypothetical protein
MDELEVWFKQYSVFLQAENPEVKSQSHKNKQTK